MNKKYNITKKFLIKEYIKNQKSTKQIAKMMDCSYSIILHWMKKYNIRRRTSIEAQKNRVLYKRIEKILTKELLIREYSKKEKNQQQIGKEFGCSEWSIGKYLRKFEITIRPSGMPKGQNIGKNNANYIDGRTSLYEMVRKLAEYKNWRNKIYKKDLWTCQECGYKGQEIEAHHKKSFIKLFNEFLKEYDQFSPIEDKETLVRLARKWQPFWDIDNGKTLCEDCHNLTKNIKK